MNAGTPELQATARRGQRRVDEHQCSDLAVHSVGDHGKQKPGTAVADKDDALTQVARCDAHRISDVMPLRFCGIGDAE